MTTAEPRPRSPKENPKQKYFIIGFSVVFVLGLVAAIFLRDQFSQTQNHFLKAWKAKDQKVLLSMASKQLVIGQFDNENSIVEDAVKALPHLLQITEKTNWSSEYKETESGDSRLRIVVSEDDGGVGNFQLLFTELPNNKWVWSGFLMMHLEDFAGLLSGAKPADPKLQYKEIQTEPAQGTEPALTD